MCHEGIQDEWRYSSTILNLSTRWRRVVNLTSQPLYPWEKSPQHPLNRRLGGLQSQSGHFLEEINQFSWWGSNPGFLPVKILFRLKLVEACFVIHDNIRNWVAILNLKSFNNYQSFFCIGQNQRQQKQLSRCTILYYNIAFVVVHSSKTNMLL